MFAIGFDLLWNQTKLTHPKGLSQAYAEIGAVLDAPVRLALRKAAK